jgi:hypothetical protein
MTTSTRRTPTVPPAAVGNGAAVTVGGGDSAAAVGRAADGDVLAGFQLADGARCGNRYLVVVLVFTVMTLPLASCT